MPTLDAFIEPPEPLGKNLETAHDRDAVKWAPAKKEGGSLVSRMRRYLGVDNELRAHGITHR